MLILVLLFCSLLSCCFWDTGGGAGDREREREGEGEGEGEEVIGMFSEFTCTQPESVHCLPVC